MKTLQLVCECGDILDVKEIKSTKDRNGYINVFSVKFYCIGCDKYYTLREG